MKVFITLLVSFVLVPLSYTSADNSVLICKSIERVDGWKAENTHDYLRFTAYVNSEFSLSKAVVNGAFSSDTQALNSVTNPKYNNLRFGPLEDAWHWFYVLLPINFHQKKGNFKASMQVYYEDDYQPGYVKMSCFVRR